MRLLINPKYQYFLLPLTYVFISFAAAINFLLIRNTRKSIEIFAITIFSAIIFYLIVPSILTTVFAIPDILDTKVGLIYLYLTSTIIGVILIKKQENFISKYQ